MSARRPDEVVKSIFSELRLFSPFCIMGGVNLTSNQASRAGILQSWLSSDNKLSELTLLKLARGVPDQVS